MVAERVYDINEFLWLQYEVGNLKTDFKPQTGRFLPYHTSCHQKLHRIGRPALDLLGLVPGLTVEEMGADCCGITGTYGYKHEKHAIAQAVGQPLFDKIVASGAATGCLRQRDVPLEPGGQHRFGCGAHGRGVGGGVQRGAWCVKRGTRSQSIHSFALRSALHALLSASFADSRLLCAY